MAKPYDYENFHKVYSADVHDDPARHGKIAELCRGIVYDIGCGTGSLSDYYTGLYLGFDISNMAIQKAKSIRRKNAMFEVLDAMKISNEDFGKADTIVMSEFLEHIENDDVIFDTIKKTARKGTRLVISVPNGSRIQCDEHVREFTIPQLRIKLSKFGHVRFYNWPGEQRQIICTCDIGEPQRADLSLVMIVKNEQKGLEKCLLSAIQYVDEIIVAIDRSSTDDSAKIAMQYSDVIKHFDWRDDFAWARNNAHFGAKGKWILFLDGHERIKQCDGLAEKLKSSADGLMCTIEMENGFEFRNPRIYKNGLQFVGAIHEKQQCKQVEFFSQFVVLHDRLGSQDEKAAEERKQQRDDMVPRIMGEQYKKDKTNTRATFHLAMHYVGKGDVDTALMWFRRYLRYSKCAGERWFVFFHMSLCYLTKRQLLRAAWYAQYADEETPGRWEVNKLKGFICFEQGRYQKAVEFLLNTFYQNTGNVDYKPWVHDDAGTWNAAGECFFRLKNYHKAHLAFAAAADQTKDERIKKFFQDRADLMKQMSIA